MFMKRIIIFLTLLTMLFPAFAQKESRDVKKGNKFYKQEKYVESEVEYRRGLEKNHKSFSGTFNLGNSLYRQKKYAEALDKYQTAATLTDDKNRKAASYHNAGNALLETGDFAKSIEAYKMALRNNPKDDETRYNLAYAQQMLQQQEQQQQNKDQQQDKQEKQDKQDQQQQQQNKQNQEQKQQQQQQSQMSKEDAERILEALQQDEKDTQRKVKEAQIKKGSRYGVDKDW